jgi:hypothetical protein
MDRVCNLVCRTCVRRKGTVDAGFGTAGQFACQVYAHAAICRSNEQVEDGVCL